ncbi:cbb3-type cytochrome c oxidase subunit I [Novosphingobium sp. JCM 18896]|uniref:cbb3-type cytochrome c oxidase subunit I n=1 Tax=Novosphingobium sp. JCM 18896 TaxID=2989731 RepID=UPI0022223ED9|nr:cbb3-type cytochrome c oxidase subunit I [Novosphingobium sp. JCM 18896]MCW1430241.1 cbb3-type cytochrome c oxidase subunit I [Novosphingobium sp. JCM 18896]
MRSETGFDPALYDRFPTKGERPRHEEAQLKRIWCAPKGWEYLTVVNNNYVGIYYLATAFLFFLLAGLLALVMRVQLAAPLMEVLPQATYNQVFTMHGTVMMFLFAVPMVEAAGVLLLPQMLAARDLPFPRLSAYAFWAYAVGGLAFFASLFVGLAPDGGWFMYPPLTSKSYSPGINTDFWLLGIGFIEISAIAGAIEIIVGVLRTRAPGMSLDKMPIFAWAMLVFAVMIVIAFPSVILATLLLEIERAFNWPFFDATRGGDPLLWQHLFWFFGHPEVYIIFLPAAGMMSMIVPTIARTELVGYRLIVLAMVATGFISFGVWAHHMFATGLPPMTAGFFSAASMAVSVPAGIQVFSWIATFAIGKPRFNTPGLFAMGSVVIFVTGGLTGVMVALVPFDWQVHDTYFIVAHLHYVLIGGMVFPLFAAMYYWTPMVSRTALSERLGKWVFGLMFVGMNVAFMPMHLAGLMGMPRRIYTYLPGTGWDLPNLISTIGAFMLALGIALFLIDMGRRFRLAPGGGNAGNTYGAGTLEWLPTELYSTRSIPVVKSREPLWDDPGLSDDVEEGRYFLPNSATGRRETIVTSPLLAEPQYLQIMPGPSPWPFAAAILTAGFFLALTVQAYTFAWVSGALATIAVLRWLWDTDQPVDQGDVDIGAGIRVPTYVTGPASHGWWAMVILMIVMGMIFAMALFSLAFLWGNQPGFWTKPLPLTEGLAIAAGYVGVVFAAWATRRLHRRGNSWATIPVILAAVAALLLTWLDARAWLALLPPDTSGQSAAVNAILCLQAMVGAIAVLMAGYLGWRAVKNLVSQTRNNTLDLTCLFVGYAGAQGLVGTLFARAIGA